MITPMLKYIDHPMALGYSFTASQKESVCSNTTASAISSACSL